MDLLVGGRDRTKILDQGNGECSLSVGWRRAHVDRHGERGSSEPSSGRMAFGVLSVSAGRVSKKKSGKKLAISGGKMSQRTQKNLRSRRKGGKSG